MEREELKEILHWSTLFLPCEVTQILDTCGRYTIGNAFIACVILGHELSGADIDILIQSSKAFDC